MITATCSATYEDKPLRVLGDLIQQRQRLLDESAQDAVVATGILALESLHALTKTAPKKPRTRSKHQWPSSPNPTISGSRRRTRQGAGDNRSDRLQLDPDDHGGGGLDAHRQQPRRGLSDLDMHPLQAANLRPSVHLRLVMGGSPSSATAAPHDWERRRLGGDERKGIIPMVELAKQQLERFAEEGVAVSPVDAVRVAEAARRLADAKADGNGTPFLAAPRVRWCGGVRFHEPTVQSELWLEEVVDALAANRETRYWLLAFSLAHADEPGFFAAPDMRNPTKIHAAARAFQRSLADTRAAVLAAVEWCAMGDAADEEPPPHSDPDRKRESPRHSRRDFIYSDLVEAIGITGSDAATLSALTLPALDRAIRRAWELGGASFKDCPAAARELAEWNWLIEEIRRKGASNEKEGRLD